MTRLSVSDHIEPTRENTAAVLTNYDIDEFEFRVEPSGVENTTFIITTKKARYALRVYRQKRRTEQEINLEIEYINFLRSYDIPAPKIVKNNHGIYVSKTSVGSHDWFSILMDFIDGEHPKHYSEKLLENFAHRVA